MKYHFPECDKLPKNDLRWLIDEIETFSDVDLSSYLDSVMAPLKEEGKRVPIINQQRLREELNRRKDLMQKSYDITIELKGDWSSRRVWLFGKELDPEPSQKIINHSPDGFAWGYGGSGPAQLALAICLEIMGPDKAPEVYQQVKADIVAGLPECNFEADFQLIA